MRGIPVLCCLSHNERVPAGRIFTVLFRDALRSSFFLPMLWTPGNKLSCLDYWGSTVISLCAVVNYGQRGFRRRLLFHFSSVRMFCKHFVAVVLASESTWKCVSSLFTLSCIPKWISLVTLSFPAQSPSLLLSMSNFDSPPLK